LCSSWYSSGGPAEQKKKKKAHLFNLIRSYSFAVNQVATQGSNIIIIFIIIIILEPCVANDCIEPCVANDCSLIYSLSPLHFCIALNPLSHELRESNTGYKPSSGDVRFNHSFYMDDLKCYARDDYPTSYC